MPGVEFSVVVRPTQTDAIPEIAVGVPLTVSTTVVRHPVGKVYVMVLLPAISALTIPVDVPIPATDVVPLDQLPPAGLEVTVPEVPVHNTVAPVIADGRALTVTEPVV